ncbi:hypothetical protein HYS72_01140 [Candidatus Pacearchaeota archaeon]|nr:hypothetical protein [Candidatus Pacearchaeota archaeon]
MKKKNNFQVKAKKIIGELLKCEGCEFEFLEAFLHAKDNKEDKVFLTIGYDEDGKPHVGIRVYDKKGRKIIW